MWAISSTSWECRLETPWTGEGRAVKSDQQFGRRDGTETTAQGGTQAVDRAAALLTYVVEADHPVTFAEATEALGLARSTTSRLLAALENNRLLERCAPGEYVGGPLFVLYAARHDRNAQLARLAQPTLERIGERTGEDVHLAVANGDQVAHIAKSTRPSSSAPATGPTSRSRRTARPSARCCWPGTPCRVPSAGSRHPPVTPCAPAATSTSTSRRCATAATPSPATSSRSASPASPHRSSDRTRT